MAMRQTTQAQATTTVDIEPALRQKLVAKLERYKQLQALAAEAKAKADKAKAVVEGYAEQVGANSMKLEGLATVTEVHGTSSKLDEKLFVQNGGSLQVLRDSTITTPKKPYWLITFEKETPEAPRRRSQSR